jgi:hypothetical protein
MGETRAAEVQGDDGAQSRPAIAGGQIPQRVGVGILSRSPARIGTARPGFIARTRSYDTPNQWAMLWRLSPDRIV